MKEYKYVIKLDNVYYYNKVNIIVYSHNNKENNSPQRNEIDELQRKLVKEGKHHWLSGDHEKKQARELERLLKLEIILLVIP